MNIFMHKPSDWVDLQNKTAYILGASGFNVETPKSIQTVRGNVEFDVFAQSKSIMLACECKYWKAKVPQSVVYTFRSQLSDAGINKGYIISMEGFQKGSYESTENTIVELRTWDEFLDEYREQYLRGQLSELLRIKRPIFRVAYDKSEYWKAYDILNQEDKRAANILREKLICLFLVMAPLCESIQYEYTSDLGWDIAYIDSVIARAAKSFGVEFCSYYDFFKYFNEQIYDTVAKIEKLYQMKIL